MRTRHLKVSVHRVLRLAIEIYLFVGTGQDFVLLPCSGVRFLIMCPVSIIPERRLVEESIVHLLALRADCRLFTTKKGKRKSRTAPSKRRPLNRVGDRQSILNGVSRADIPY